MKTNDLAASNHPCTENISPAKGEVHAEETSKLLVHIRGQHGNVLPADTEQIPFDITSDSEIFASDRPIHPGP